MKRYTGNAMSLSHFHDFYFLEALQAAIIMGRSSHPEWAFRHPVERFETDVKEAFEHLCKEMSLRIYVYLWAASLGEARHAQGRSIGYIKGLSSKARSAVYELSPDYFPCQENVQTLKDVFDQRWTGAYGGKAWLNIVNALDLFDKVSPATFIDHTVDLEHNSGNVFTKRAQFGLSCDTYAASRLKAFLNHKFSKNILTQSMGLLQVSSKVKTLLRRYINIFLKAGSAEYIKTLLVVEGLDGTLEWLDGYTIDWDYKMLERAGTFEKPEPPKKRKPIDERREVRLDEKKCKPENLDGYKPVTKIEKGKKYYIKRTRGSNIYWAYDMYKYDGRTLTCQAVVVNNGREYAKFPGSGFMFSHHWLFEKEEQAEAEEGKRYIVHFDGKQHDVGWVGGMDKYNGRVIKITGKHYAGGYAHGFIWANEWLLPYNGRHEERRERRSKKEEVGGGYYKVLPKPRKLLGSFGGEWVAPMDKMIGNVYYFKPYTSANGEVYLHHDWNFDPKWLMKVQRNQYSKCECCGNLVPSNRIRFVPLHTKYSWLCSGCKNMRMARCPKCGDDFPKSGACKICRLEAE